MKTPTRDICGAQTHTGSLCQRPPISGSNRCRLHGGVSTGPTAGSGYYLRHIPPETLEGVVPLGCDLTHDIAIARARVDIIQERERQWSGDNLPVDSYEVNATTEIGEDGKLKIKRQRPTVIRHKRPDFDARMDAALARVGYLIERQAKLNELQDLRDEVAAIMKRLNMPRAAEFRAAKGRTAEAT
jgi:hypothetical protein